MEENQKKKKKIPTIVWWLLAIVLCAGFFLGPTVVANIKEERYNKKVEKVQAVADAWFQGMMNHDVEVLKKVFPRDKFHEKYKDKGDNSIGKSDEEFYFGTFSIGDYMQNINNISFGLFDEMQVTIYGKPEPFFEAQVYVPLQYSNGSETYRGRFYLDIFKDQDGTLYVDSLGISKIWDTSLEN